MLPVGLIPHLCDGVFQSVMCLRRLFPDPLYPLSDLNAAFSACATTDTGGGLLLAGNQFAVQKRPEALWVVVLLTDGMANATLPVKANVGVCGQPRRLGHAAAVLVPLSHRSDDAGGEFSDGILPGWRLGEQDEDAQPGRLQG